MLENKYEEIDKLHEQKKLARMNVQDFEPKNLEECVEDSVNIKDTTDKKYEKQFLLYEEQIKELEDEKFNLENELNSKKEDEIKVYKKILKILDQIDLIHKYSVDSNNVELKNILEISQKQIMKYMKEINLEQIHCIGEILDPSIHKCEYVGKKNEAESNEEIVSVIENGYKLNGEVLRYASVAVVK